MNVQPAVTCWNSYRPVHLVKFRQRERETAEKREIGRERDTQKDRDRERHTEGQTERQREERQTQSERVWVTQPSYRPCYDTWQNTTDFTDSQNRNAIETSQTNPTSQTRRQISDDYFKGCQRLYIHRHRIWQQKNLFACAERAELILRESAGWENLCPRFPLEMHPWLRTFQAVFNGFHSGVC